MRSNIKSYSVYLGKYVNPIYTSILILMFFVMNQFFFSYLSEIKIISTITSLILPAVIDIIFILIFFKYIWSKENIRLCDNYIETNKFDKIYFSDIQSTELSFSKGSESLILVLKNSKKITLTASNRFSNCYIRDYNECKKEIINKIIDRRG